MAIRNWLAAVAALIYVFTVPLQWLVASRVLLLLVGVLTLLCYMSDERSRPFATGLAIIVAGSSLALAFQGVTQLPSPGLEPWLLLYVFGQTAVIIGNRGNVAHMLLRRVS